MAFAAPARAATPVEETLLKVNPCGEGFDIAACQGLRQYRLGDTADARRIWRELAEDGDVVAMRLLGMLHHRGEGLTRDPANAARWYRRAADRGDAPAQLALGRLHEQGLGVRRDLEQAADLYRAAMNGGSARAAFELALMHETGRGVPRDRETWLRLLRVAAFRGLPEAQLALGRYYQDQDNTDGHHVRAHAFFIFARESAREPAVRSTAEDAIFALQSKVSAQERSNAVSIAREWRLSLLQQGGRAEF